MSKVLDNIRNIRESKGYSQEHMASLIGITQSSYARFERGATKTDLELVEKIASIFNMQLIDVITYPERYVNSTFTNSVIINQTKQEIKATLTIEMGKEKKDQIFRFIFGDNDLKISSK